MTPHAALITELYLVLTNAETDAALFRAAHGRGATIQIGALEDHRTNVLGELIAAIDRVEPTLGTRIQRAMYPTTSEEEGPAPTVATDPGPRNSGQVFAEIVALESLKPSVRQVNTNGFDNHQAIDAQLRVLQERMDEDAVQAAFFAALGDAGALHTLAAALQACTWLETGNDTPSEDWQHVAGV